SEPAGTAASDAGSPTVTNPAPARIAPRAASTGAPANPRAPPRIATRPNRPLCPSAGRRGSARSTHGAVAISVGIGASRTSEAGTPMSATYRRPTCAAAGYCTVPTFGRAIATVAALEDRLEVAGRLARELRRRDQQQHAHHGLAGEVPRGHQTVAAVVPFAGQDDHPAGPLRPQQEAGHFRRAQPGLLHERGGGNAVLLPAPLLQAGHLSGRGQLHRLAEYAVRRPAIDYSARACAMARRRVWEIASDQARTPRRSATAAARPLSRTPGLLSGSVVISISCHPTPAKPTPSAFMTASLAAKRPASRGAASGDIPARAS